MAECLARNSGVSAYADRFVLKSRSICADKAGYNIKGEQILCSQRSPSWVSTLLPCELHALAGVHKKTFDDFFASDISGLIHCSLSLRFQHTWSCFKRALCQVIKTRVQVLVGKCPAAALAHKRTVLRLCTDGTNHVSLATLVGLISGANGDWRNRQRVEVYLQREEAETADLNVVADQVSQQLLFVLGHRKPGLWRRDKWNGFKPALLDLWLLDEVHGLLQPTFQMMLQLLQEPSKPFPAAAPPQGQPSQAPQQDTVGPAASSAEGGFASEGPDSARAADSASSQPSGSLAAQNAKDRSLAKAWIEKKPLAHLSLMLVALTPLDKLLHKTFQVSGQDFEQEQRALLAEGMLKTTPTKRLHRLQLAADQTLEQEFFLELYSAYHDTETWDTFPEQHRTRAFQALGFRVLARLGASVHQLVAHQHTVYPIKLWRLLSSPGDALLLSNDPPCVKDDWTNQLQQKYPGFLGAELQAVLQLQATVQLLEIGQVESKHASIRRQVVAHSVQTWRMAFWQASCEWLLQNYRVQCPKKLQSNKKSMQVCWQHPFHPLPHNRTTLGLRSSLGSPVFNKAAIWSLFPSPRPEVGMDNLLCASSTCDQARAGECPPQLT